MRGAKASLSPTDNPDFARLADLLREMPVDTMERLLSKKERLSLLLTPVQKEEIVAAANAAGLTITEYCVRALAIVEMVRREHQGK